MTVAEPDRLTVRFDDDRIEVLAGEELASDRLVHAYAVTVHRMQGATVDRTHLFADGGGRELAYVAMSRARDASIVYVVADDHKQAVEDLRSEWSRDRRQRWVLDVDEPAIDDRVHRPSLAHRTESALRLARLQREREAVAAVVPPSHTRLRSLDLQLRFAQLEAEPRAREVGRSLGR